VPETCNTIRTNIADIVLNYAMTGKLSNRDTTWLLSILQASTDVIEAQNGTIQFLREEGLKKDQSILDKDLQIFEFSQSTPQED